MRVNVTVGLGKSETVKLKKHVPVHFVYITAWANENGVVHFRPDIYGQDGAAAKYRRVARGGSETSILQGSPSLDLDDDFDTVAGVAIPRVGVLK